MRVIAPSTRPFYLRVIRCAGIPHARGQIRRADENSIHTIASRNRFDLILRVSGLHLDKQPNVFVRPRYISDIVANPRCTHRATHYLYPLVQSDTRPLRRPLLLRFARTESVGSARRCPDSALSVPGRSTGAAPGHLCRRATLHGRQRPPEIARPCSSHRWAHVRHPAGCQSKPVPASISVMYGLGSVNQRPICGWPAARARLKRLVVICFPFNRNGKRRCRTRRSPPRWYRPA